MWATIDGGIDRYAFSRARARGYTFREAIREKVEYETWDGNGGPERLVLNPLTLPALLGRERFKRFLNEAGKKLPSFVKYSKYSVWPSFSSLVEWKNLTVNSILSLRSKRVFSLFSSSSSFSFSWSLRIELEIFVFFFSLSLRRKGSPSPRFRITFLLVYLRSSSRYTR